MVYFGLSHAVKYCTYREASLAAAMDAMELNQSLVSDVPKSLQGNVRIIYRLFAVRRELIETRLVPSTE